MDPFCERLSIQILVSKIV